MDQRTAGALREKSRGADLVLALALPDCSPPPTPGRPGLAHSVWCRGAREENAAPRLVPGAACAPCPQPWARAAPGGVAEVRQGPAAAVCKQAISSHYPGLSARRLRPERRALVWTCQGAAAPARESLQSGRDPGQAPREPQDRAPCARARRLHGSHVLPGRWRCVHFWRGLGRGRATNRYQQEPLGNCRVHNSRDSGCSRRTENPGPPNSSRFVPAWRPPAPPRPLSSYKWRSQGSLRSGQGRRPS